MAETSDESNVDYPYFDHLGAGAIFFPRSDPQPPPPAAEDLDIPVADGITVGARAYVAQTEWPTLLYFHGNGEVASDHDDIAALYHAIDCNLVVAEFRGYGRSTGQPTLANLLGDVRAVAPWFHTLLDERGVSGPRYLMGRSLGAYPALEVAACHPANFSGVIIESGAANLFRLAERLGVGDDPRALEIAAAHDAKIRAIDLPALIIHGEADTLVPPAQATRLAELLGARCERLLTIPQAGHNDLLWIGREAYFSAIAQFIH